MTIIKNSVFGKDIFVNFNVIILIDPKNLKQHHHKHKDMFYYKP